MYNLTEYSKNYRKTTGILWKYYRGELSPPPLNDNGLPTVNYDGNPMTNFYHINTKAVLQEKHEITMTMIIKVIIGKKQRCSNCSTIKRIKQFLKNFRYTIDELWNKFYFDMV